MKLLLSLALLIKFIDGFSPILPNKVTTLDNNLLVGPLNSIQTTTEGPLDSFLDGIKMRLRIAQESNASGASTKQTIADVIAGEYDSVEVGSKLDDMIASAPVVMFTWESSPSCKKAVGAFETIGADVKICRLDDPWSEGNPMRAELGKRVGRTSVPFLFIKGEYVGGFDGGTDENACGMVDMAFKGTLRSKLSEVGAMKA